jgi:3-hydroxyisobutyrate dehydrogenase
MGQRIIHCGPAGSGLAAKICNNLILGVEQIVVAEAMLLGQRLGLDPAVLAGVINNSTGACWSSSVNNPVPGALPDKSPPCERGFEGGFATALMIKAGGVKGLLIDKFDSLGSGQDMGLATECFKGSGSPVPLAEAAEKIYMEAVER